MRREPWIALAIIVAGLVGVKGFHIYEAMSVDKSAYLSKADQACNRVVHAINEGFIASQLSSKNPLQILNIQEISSFPSVAEAFSSASQYIKEIKEVPYGCDGIQTELSTLATSCDQLASDLDSGVEGIGRAADHMKLVGDALADVRMQLNDAKSPQ